MSDPNKTSFFRRYTVSEVTGPGIRKMLSLELFLSHTQDGAPQFQYEVLLEPQDAIAMGAYLLDAGKKAQDQRLTPSHH